MTIDIVGLIREIDRDGSGEIEFEEFKMLLKSGFANEGNWKDIFVIININQYTPNTKEMLSDMYPWLLCSFLRAFSCEFILLFSENSSIFSCFFFKLIDYQNNNFIWKSEERERK